MKQVIDPIKYVVRALIRYAAQWFNTASSGRVTPAAVTIFGLLMHLPIAIMIARGKFGLAGVLLIIFGLFGSLDSELSRIQKKPSVHGLLLSASTNRMQEVMLYSGAGFYLAHGVNPTVATWAVIASGASLTASYIKTKGEAAGVSGKISISCDALNKMFVDGLLTFEVRIFVLILGLLTGQLLIAVAGIAILASLTAVQRLITISEKLT